MIGLSFLLFLPISGPAFAFSAETKLELAEKSEGDNIKLSLSSANSYLRHEARLESARSEQDQ